MAVSLEPLAARFGVRVHGLDLHSPNAQLGAQLQDLLDQHQLLFFHPQDIDNATQAAVMDLLGDPYIHPLAVVAGKTTASPTHIIDDADHPPYQDGWHTDVTFDPHPPVYGSLRCIEMPQRGGNTIWADTYTAHENLSPTFQGMIANLVAQHDMGEGAAFASKTNPDLLQRTRQDYTDTEHGVVHTHPRTGRQHLYVNPTFTRRISGMTPGESQLVLEAIYGAMTSPNLQYRHQWTEGEFCIWDERTTMHLAVADHYPARREMVRYVVK